VYQPNPHNLIVIIPVMSFESIVYFCAAHLLKFNFKFKAGFRSFCIIMTTQETRR